LPNRRRTVAARLLRSALSASVLLPFVCAASGATAQSATAVPQLAPNSLIGTYFEIARYPIKREKHCVSDEMILYGLNDKPNTFKIVTICQLKGDTSDFWNGSGKFSETGNGQLKLNWIWPFTTKYWILALAPDYTWALVGTPNHKSLWILSLATTLPPDVLASIEAQASAQGFNTSKLIQITQQPRPPVPRPTTSQPANRPAVANPPAKPSSQPIPDASTPR
jgi:apolipoprotein D and lipocalin family protein